MANFKDMEDSLRSFIVQEQSDAHSARNINVAKYNNIKLWMDAVKNPLPHVNIRISISEASYSLNGFSKINGGLGYEERFVIKWFTRYGVKEKLADLWNNAERTREDV